jgi:peptide/nickel transport system substrate-binding protein
MKRSVLFVLAIGVSAVLLSPWQLPAGPAASGQSDHLVFGLYQQIVDSFDPHVTNGTVNGSAYFLILDPLIWKTARGYRPGLAESWEVSADASEYTFRLRKGVTFHDGTAFNARAVKANFDRIVDPRTRSRIALGFMGSYRETVVVDDSTVRVRFARPYAPFLDGVSQPFLGMVSPAAVERWGTEVGLHLVGTGPFMLQEYIAGKQVVVTRNPKYNWAPDLFDRKGPPELRAITLSMLVEDATRVAAFERGEVHAIERVPSAEIARFKEKGINVGVYLQPGMPVSLMMNTSKPPLDDLRVRQALLHAVNREELAETFFKGVHKAAYGPISAATWGYVPSVRRISPFDLGRAQTLLSEAGWMPGADGIRVKGGERLRLEVIYIAAAGFDDTWQLVQAQLRRAGVDSTLAGMAGAPALERAAAGNFNLMHLRWTFSDPDTMNVMWHSRNVTGGTGFNFSKVRNPQIDILLESAAAERNLEKRRALYYRAQELIMQDAYLIPIYDEGNAVATSPRIEGLRVDPRGRYPLLYGVRFRR